MAIKAQSTGGVAVRQSRKKSATKPVADATVVLQTLHDEHKYLTSLHTALEYQVNLLKPGRNPDYAVLRDMLRYLAEYPDMHHHPLEDKVFERLLRRHHDSNSDVHELYAQHRDMARETRFILEKLEVICKNESPPLRNRLRLYLHDYLVFYRQHIELEESRVFPAAKQHLTAADWQAIRQQLQTYSDPVFGSAKSSRYANLTAVLRKNLQFASSEVALAELFSAYAVIESTQAVVEGLAGVRKIISASVKKGWSENREFLRHADATTLFFAPFWMGYNSIANTAEALSDTRKLLGDVATGAGEPFSSRLKTFRQLNSKQQNSNTANKVLESASAN